MRAPFRAVENPQWKKLALMQNPLFPLPSATTIRNRLRIQIQEVEHQMLSRLVPGSKVALSLDCWSAASRTCYMGIIAYYISSDWEYVEELIEFENLKEIHSGASLAQIVNDVVIKYSLVGRVISITTDNASNNGTMISEINMYLEDALTNRRFLDGTIQHIPCLSHICQLGLKALLGKIRSTPTNDTFIRNWQQDQELDDLARIRNEEERGVPYTLAKV